MATDDPGIEGHDQNVKRLAARDRNEADERPILGSSFERSTSLASALASAVDAKGSYYPSHSQGVAQISRSIAEYMGLSPSICGRVAVAGLLHDVGKLLIPDRILLKPDQLTDDENLIMRTHPVEGERILIASGYGGEAQWVRHHHSRWDGKGYPDYLSGEQIPLEARIIGVADAFHAMQSDRPYRRAHPSDVAISELVEHSGEQFCPSAVKAVIDMDKTR